MRKIWIKKIHFRFSSIMLLKMAEVLKFEDAKLHNAKKFFYKKKFKVSFFYKNLFFLKMSTLLLNWLRTFYLELAFMDSDSNFDLFQGLLWNVATANWIYYLLLSQHLETLRKYHTSKCSVKMWVTPLFFPIFLAVRIHGQIIFFF